jgi:hypothetical protein
MNTSLQKRLSAERFPEMDATLRAVLDFVFEADDAAIPFTKITVGSDGQVRAWSAASDVRGVAIAREADLCIQLRRLAQVAGLTPQERQAFDFTIFRKLGISLAPRHSCKTP